MPIQSNDEGDIEEMNTPRALNASIVQTTGMIKLKSGLNEIPHSISDPSYNIGSSVGKTSHRDKLYQEANESAIKVSMNKDQTPKRLNRQGIKLPIVSESEDQSSIASERKERI